MHELFRVQQRTAFLEQLDDGRIGIPNLQPVVLGKAVAQDAFFIHVAGGVESVLHAGGEVFRAVRGRGVNHAGAGVHGDVVGQHAEDFAIEKGMLKVEALHLAPGEACQFLRVLKVAFLGHIGSQPGRHDVRPRPRIQAQRTLRGDGTPPPSTPAVSREWWSR